MRRLHEFGRLLGIAYQIYDDCLDLVGAEKVIGKTLGSDLQGGKLTLPLILLLQRAQESESHLISSILLNEHASSQAMLMDFIHRYDTLTAAATQARDILREAAALLTPLPSNPGRAALTQLTHFLDRELARLA
jgi:octaprenyl-diphosphate synthase